MGAIAAAVNKKGRNAVPDVVAMLQKLTHRGADAHGVATPNSVRIAKSIDDMTAIDINSNVAIGHNLCRIISRDRPQPVLSEGFALAFEGRLFPPLGKYDVDEVMEKFKLDPKRNASHMISELDGSYVFAIALPDEIVVGRDTVGTSPLYYGENETVSAVASERKALWALEINSVKSFPPGNLAVIDVHGFSFKSIKTVTRPRIKNIDLETATNNLQNLLSESTRERVSGLKKTAVAFSGGLDCSVIAFLAKLCGIKVHLISVGLKNQPELQHAEKAAEALGLPLRLQTYTIDDVERVLAKVLWLIEEPDAVKASIAIPFYWAAENASKMRCRVLLAGQGGDELFGGYQRYLIEYAHSGSSALMGLMYRDVATSYEKNFQRDNQVCSFHGVELRLPFADRELIRFSLSLPLSLKIISPDDSLRKRVLRQVAQNLGLPSFIVKKPKKAIQYATGVSKALKILARREGLGLQEYVKRTFKKVYSCGEV